MSGYPDNYGDPSVHDDEDMEGVEKLSCGCYEEACDCNYCEHCGEKYNDTTDTVPDPCEQQGFAELLCEFCLECNACGEYHFVENECCVTYHYTSFAAKVIDKLEARIVNLEAEVNVLNKKIGELNGL